MPLRLRYIQNDGSLVGTAYRDGTHYAVTQHRWLPRSDLETSHYKLYLVHTERDNKLRPSDVLDQIGELIFRLHGQEDGRKVAAVSWSEIDVNFRGTGLGKIFYKMAINDLLERGFVVQSDTARSPEAQRLWKSLSKEAPERVIDPAPDYDFTYHRFKVRRFLRRPEVRVRRHRRLK